jgi:hypothetical protein
MAKVEIKKQPPKKDEIQRTGNVLKDFKNQVRGYFNEFGIVLLSLFGILFFFSLGNETDGKFGSHIFLSYPNQD